MEEDTISRYRGCEEIVFDDYMQEQFARIIRQRFTLAGIQYQSTLGGYLWARYWVGTPVRELFGAIKQTVDQGRGVNIENVKRALDNETLVDYSRVLKSLKVEEVILLGAIASVQNESYREYCVILYLSSRPPPILHNSPFHSLQNKIRQANSYLRSEPRAYFGDVYEEYVKAWDPMGGRR